MPKDTKKTQVLELCFPNSLSRLYYTQKAYDQFTKCVTGDGAQPKRTLDKLNEYFANGIRNFIGEKKQIRPYKEALHGMYRIRVDELRLIGFFKGNDYIWTHTIHKKTGPLSKTATNMAKKGLKLKKEETWEKK